MHVHTHPMLRLFTGTRTSVRTHYCLAVGNDEGLELDETDKDEELGKGDKK